MSVIPQSLRCLRIITSTAKMAATISDSTSIFCEVRKKTILRVTLSPTRQRPMHQLKSAHRSRGPGQVLRRLVRPTCSDDIQGDNHENCGDNHDEGDSLVLSKVIQGDDQNDDYESNDDYDNVQRPVCLVFSKDIQGTTASPRIREHCGRKETVVHVSLLPERARSSSGAFSFLGQNFTQMVRAQNCV